jgi:hypothetical protein
MKFFGTWLCAFNCLGIAAYLMLAARGWAPTDGLPVTGEPFVWALCLPVLFFFVIFDVAWISLIAWKKLTSWLPFGITAALWMCAVAIDFTQH